MLAALTAVLTVLYPLLIWFGHGRVEPRWMACVLLLAAASRVPSLKVSVLARWSVFGALLLAGAAVAANAMLPLKLYPVLVNAAMLAAFGYSLFVPPSMIERLARLREPDLPDVAIGYTRRVTQVWCVFFVFNGTLALVFALWGSEALWSLYTGVISYLLMGLLLGGELLLRRRFKRLHHG